MMAEPEAVVEELEVYRTWIRNAALVCEKAAQGNLEERLLGCPAEGDLGRVLHGINHLLDMTDAFVREARATMDHAAQGKFFRRVLLRGMRGTFQNAAAQINGATAAMAGQSEALKESENRRKQMGAQFAEVIQTLASSATELRVTAQTLSTTANQTREQSLSAGVSADQTSKNMTNVSEATETLRHEAFAVDSKMRECLALANEATSQAQGAGPVMENLVAVSRRMSGVVKVVSNIAAQTNLLALNAKIEASRAGDLGRGFGVVADEVKDLSRKTATATDQIELEIAEMENAATRVSTVLERISQHIHGVDHISALIAESVERQRESVDRIAENVQLAARASHDVSKNISVVSDAARQTNLCASQLVDSSSELSRHAETLHLRSEEFLKS